MEGATFVAECEACGGDREFTELQRERRRMGPGGHIEFELEFSFRCGGCGAREEKVVDRQGVLHKWNGRKHVTFET